MGAYWFSSYIREGEDCSFGELTVYDGRFVRDMIGQNNYFRLNTEGFCVSPGHVMLDLSFPLFKSPSPPTSCDYYIKKGCTLLLVQHPVTSLRHYRKLYDKFRRHLGQLPIDFMIVPVIKADAVRAEMVRFFARESCPFLCVEIESKEDLERVSWEWLVQAQAHRRIPLTISVKDPEDSLNNYSQLWSSLCKQYGMIKLTDLQDVEFVSAQNLRDTGIFPYKGGFISGGYADYNLYCIDKDRMFDEDGEFRYHDSVPNVTVMRGQVLQVNQQLEDQLAGKHQQVSIYKHFV